MSFPEFYVTNGTIRIDLLSGINGFYLDSWKPAAPTTKDVYKDSPFSDGQKLTMQHFQDPVDSFSFKVAGFTQNDVIFSTQDLRRLLEDALSYWKGGSDTPVWIEVRASNETNMRYATIKGYRAPYDEDPFHSPFETPSPVMADWSLVLQHEIWRGSPPGESTCVQQSATQDFLDEQTSSFVPTQSADDASTNSAAGGSIDLAGNNMTVGISGASTFNLGVRFRSVTIPAGAIIINAWIDFEADQADAGDNCNATIYGDDEDNAAVFSTYADYNGRPVTTASTLWSAIPHWVAGTHYLTPGIRLVVQEIVSRAGWASGNSLAILIKDNTSTAGAIRRPASWNSARADPTLYVWWFDTHTLTFGRTATCNNEVYIANKHNQAQLTHVFHYDDSTATFSSNLIGAALPFAFLPAAPAVNDIVYFGIASVATGSGPFSSLVFDILAREVNIAGASWQYWNGAWVALPVQDNTNINGSMTDVPFSTLGVNSVHWQQSGSWVATTVNGVTGWWVRLIVTGVGVNVTPPTQQNRNIYTIVTPYLDIQSSQVPGDLPALAKSYLTGQSGLNGSTAMAQIQIIMGLRRYERGANFTSYINLADTQNQSGVTVTVNGGTATFANDLAAPTGRVIDWTTGGAAARAWLFYITLGSALVTHYAGTFRLFLRYKDISGGGATFWSMSGVYDYNNLMWTSEPKTTSLITYFRYIDFGQITLPPVTYDQGKTFNSLILRVDASCSVNAHFHLSDLILMPCDECLIETTASVTPAGLYVGTYSPASYLGRNPVGGYTNEIRRLDVDSLIPRRRLLTQVEDEVTGITIQSWEKKSGSPHLLQANKRQRLWFFMDINTGSDINPSRALSSQSYVVPRYLMSRGAR